MAGKIVVFTGDGKGKTTSAIGRALTAAGNGQKVYIAQFIKAGDSNERKALDRLADLITAESFGLGGFFGRRNPTPEDIQAARDGLEKVACVIASGDYAVMILDEANVAIKYNLFSAQDLLNILDTQADQLEMIITGRYADEKIIERADLVFEFNALKHYYNDGISARAGIEK
jgi:cob(I)alamin adenosyltransferase